MIEIAEPQRVHNMCVFLEKGIAALLKTYSLDGTIVLKGLILAQDGQ